MYFTTKQHFNKHNENKRTLTTQYKTEVDVPRDIRPNIEYVVERSSKFAGELSRMT